MKIQPINDQLNNQEKIQRKQRQQLLRTKHQQLHLLKSQSTETIAFLLHLQLPYNTDGLALKLIRLKEKSARYVSHKYFVSQCIKSKLVLKGLELTIEPTAIRNDDQDFIDNRYLRLKDFSLVLMEQTVSCEKAMKETALKLTILNRF